MPTPPPDPPTRPTKTECWNEFWDVVARAWVDARRRKAAERIAHEKGRNP